MHKRKSLGIMALLACLTFTGSRGQEEYRNAIPAADTKPGTDIARSTTSPTCVWG